MNVLVPVIGAVCGLVGVIATALVSAWLARRNASGTIRTTEADDLWQASRDSHTALSADLAAARTETDALRRETMALRAELVTGRTESVALREETLVMRAELVALRQETKLLREQVAGALKRRPVRARP